MLGLVDKFPFQVTYLLQFGKVNPWHLWIVTAHASVNGNCLLVTFKWCCTFDRKWDFTLYNRNCIFVDVLVLTFLLCIFSNGLIVKLYQDSLNLLWFWSVIIFVTVPLAPFVNPSLTSILFVTICLLPLWAVKLFLGYLFDGVFLALNIC